MASATSSAPVSEGRNSSLSGPAWLMPKALAWFGASTGALTAVCTVFGYLVEHAYLDQLGVPRTVYEATSREYVVSGAQFLAGLIPLSGLGSVLFLIHYWWVALASIVVAVLAWRLRLSSRTRFLCAGIIYAAWIIAMALRFDSVKAPDEQGLAMFAFGTVAAFLYCSCEMFVASRSLDVQRPTSDFFARLLLYALLICSAFALPIVKGIHGTVRETPRIEFLGKDREFVCALVGAAPQASDPDCGPWQLIEFGKERTLFRKPPDANVYVVPTSSITTFRLQPSRSSK